MFSFRYISGVCKHKKTALSYRMGQKAPNCCSHDRFYRVTFHKVV